jgi:hypothetical protein
MPPAQNAMLDMSWIQQTMSVSLALQQQQDTLEILLDMRHAQSLLLKLLATVVAPLDICGMQETLLVSIAQQE